MRLNNYMKEVGRHLGRERTIEKRATLTIKLKRLISGPLEDVAEIDAESLVVVVTKGSA
jgi:hypothetical protein